MKDKYIKFFKKELVFLLILLVVICFSFGVSYSNFIYNSTPKRAVEMFTGKLSYEMKINGIITNEINVYPGTTLVNVEVRSLNPVKSYYKLGYKSENVNVYIYGENFDHIDEDETIQYKLLVVNNNTYNRVVSFDISGGFINNTIDDVTIKADYAPLDISIKEGSTVEYEGNTFRVLGITSDSKIEMISSDLDLNISLNGANGYNNVVTIINNAIKDKFNYDKVISARSVNLEDITKYSSNDSVSYNNSGTYCKNSGFLSYPKLFEYEKNGVIDYVDKNGSVSPSDEYYIETPETNNASCISSKIINVSNIDFISDIYADIFSHQESFLATRYNNNNGIIEWGVMSISSGNLELNKLYDSNGNGYSTSNKVRAIVTLNNKINIELVDNVFQVK